MTDRTRDRPAKELKGGGLSGGINAAELGEREKDPLGGTGGSSGGGTGAGSGEVSGGTTDRTNDPAQPFSGDSGDAVGGHDEDGELAGRRPVERSSVPGAGPTGAEAIGQGAGRGTTGSGTPSDKSGLGGGGMGPRGTAGPGGDNRR